MIWTIAKRELVTRGRSKGYLILTGILFVGVLALGVAIRVLDGGDGTRDVTIGVAADGVTYRDGLAAGDDDLDVTVVDVADGEVALTDGEIDVFFDGSSLTWEGSPDGGLDNYIRTAVQQVAIGERVQAAGLTPEALGQLFEPVEIEEVRLDGTDEAESTLRLTAAGVSTVATFMLLQVWGSFLMMGVIEEKSSKVVEILLSHVRPATLLAGKTLGLGILALTQMLIVVLGIVVGLVMVRDIDVPAGVWGTVPVLLITFLLGFAFYATAFAAVGSMVSRQEDAQSAQLPAMLPLLAGYFIGITSLASPGNIAVTVGSFVPFTSPVLLPLRQASVSVPVWQVLLSLAILAVSSVVMLRLAGGIYRYSLLRSGSRVQWRDAWANRGEAGM